MNEESILALLAFSFRGPTAHEFVGAPDSPLTSEADKLLAFKAPDGRVGTCLRSSPEVVHPEDERLVVECKPAIIDEHGPIVSWAGTMSPILQCRAKR